MSKQTFGRKLIYTDAEYIDRNNVLSVLENSYQKHVINRNDIDYLYKYYRGEQPSLLRVKQVRPEINTQLVVNHANAIVSFKVGYGFGKPILYIPRSTDEAVIEGVDKLNEYMFSEDKACADTELAEWFNICGTSYRMALPDDNGDKDYAPFELFTLDPRDTFVVYSNSLGNKPIMGVTYVTKENQEREYSIYTKDRFFVVREGGIVDEKVNPIGEIPIVEYPNNKARLGSFEVVLSLLDAINDNECARCDAIEQFVQALMVFEGVDISAEDFMALKDQGAIKIPEGASVKLLVEQLNQNDTQTAIDDLLDKVLAIVGMPSQGSGKTSDSSNNGAIVLKNGWQGAETRAETTEKYFERSERQTLKLILLYCNELRNMNVKLSDIDIHFTRRNYENITEKANVLVQMLSNEKINPRLAFEYSGMFTDPNSAYLESMDYYEESKQSRVDELAQALKAEDGEENANTVQENGQGDSGNQPPVD